MTKPKSYLTEGFCPTCVQATTLDRGRCGWCGTQVHEMPDLRRVPYLMTDETVERARVLYFVTGLSLRETAEVVFHETEYASTHSCANALMRQFRALGLNIRTKAEAASVRTGLAR